MNKIILFEIEYYKCPAIIMWQIIETESGQNFGLGPTPAETTFF